MDYLHALKFVCIPGTEYKQWRDNYSSSPIREDGLETMAYMTDYRFKASFSLITFIVLMTQRVPCEFKGWMNDKLVYHYVKFVPKHPFSTLFMYSSFIYCFALSYKYAYRFQTSHKNCDLLKYNQ